MLYLSIPSPTASLVTTEADVRRKKMHRHKSRISCLSPDETKLTACTAGQSWNKIALRKFPPKRHSILPSWLRSRWLRTLSHSSWLRYNSSARHQTRLFDCDRATQNMINPVRINRALQRCRNWHIPIIVYKHGIVDDTHHIWWEIKTGGTKTSVLYVWVSTVETTRGRTNN